ncbi:MAG: L-asparaginase [Burkholderiaceae bacterium]|jgi:hypothetical protein|nr:L-asparaginase [Burkholderiaceae bacterium]
MKPIAPGTVVFHRYRGYGVLMAVNLLTGWVSVRFGSEQRCIDLCLSSDELQYANGEPILFRREAPDRMPQARLMAMMRCLHQGGYQRLYLYVWPQPSGMHWRWHLFAGRRDWIQRPWREGWYGSGSDYAFNPVMGWGDSPGATSDELIEALARFDPDGLAQALGKDEEHTGWFAGVCDALLPGYTYSMGGMPGHGFGGSLPVHPVRTSLKAYDGAALSWPPGWRNMFRWRRESQPCRHLLMI